MKASRLCSVSEICCLAKELGSLNDQLESSNDSETDSSVDSSQDVQEEGTISPSHSSESSTDESLNSLLAQIKPLLPQNNGTWSVYVCNLMKNTEGVIDDQPMQAAIVLRKERFNLREKTVQTFVSGRLRRMGRRNSPFFLYIL